MGNSSSKIALEEVRRKKVERNIHISFRMMDCEETDMMLYLESAIEFMWKSVEMIYIQSKNAWKEGKD